MPLLHLNYSENYSLHSSGVVFDILFRGVRLWAAAAGTLQMVEANELGKTVSSMADFAPERLLDEAVHDRYVRNIGALLPISGAGAGKGCGFSDAGRSGITMPHSAE